MRIGRRYDAAGPCRRRSVGQGHTPYHHTPTLAPVGCNVRYSVFSVGRGHTPYHHTPTLAPLGM